jgi:hypothetical protein
MDEKAMISTSEIPLFDETNYSSWRINMKECLKSKGVDVWDTVVVGSIPSKKKPKYASLKEAKKNNSVAFKTIFDGLSDLVKERIGQCTSAKDLWLKLEKTYQGKKEDREDNPIKDVKHDQAINEGKDSPKFSDCNSPKCNDTNFSLENKEEDVKNEAIATIDEVCIEPTNLSYIDKEEYLLKLKVKVMDSLDDVDSERSGSSSDFNELEENIKDSLDEYHKKFMILK